MVQNITVSVVMITYMHEAFIKRAIESILCQICDFEIELIIANDNSPDNTHNIILSIIENHPEASRIKYLKNDKNLGMMSNLLYALSEAKGQFIALCEGDDYWLDVSKLQKQFEFLHNNHDYSMCFHNASESDNSFLLSEPYCKINKNTLFIEDFIYNHFVPTASIFFRNNLEYPEWSKNVHSGDKLIIFLNAIKGKIGYFNEIMSHYNVTDIGVSRSIEHRGLNKVYNMSYLYSKLDEYTNFEFKDIFKKGLVYEINIHLLEPYRKELKTNLLIKEIFIRILIKWFKYKRKS